jgi:high-affinity nickel-transport protein
VLSLLLLGFLLGLRHATDPDHVVAVTTIVTRERRLWSSSVIGAFWGLGHTATVVLLGGAIILCDVAIPPRLGLGLEAAVALMLVALGVANLTGLLGRAHRAVEGAIAPAHVGPRGPIGLRPLLIGLVHGLAGSAAVALLVLATIHDRREALLYLGVFCLGTIAGMVALTTALGLPFAYASRRLPRVQGWLAGATGLLSVGMGIVLVYQLTVVGGLLTGTPQWTPQ